VVGAYRMPNKFMELTDVGTDILFFRKKWTRNNTSF
jgi:hypothetical protein